MKRNILALLGIGVIAVGLTGCSDDFLREKKDYERYTAEVLNNYQGAQLRVNAIYGQCLPNPSAVSSWNNNYTGLLSSSDYQSQNTEEYAGIGLFVDAEKELSSAVGNLVPDYFQNEQKHLSNVWGRIRGINNAIEAIGASTLTQEQKDELVGQCYFFRAWCYYQLVKWYGGVPIVKDVLETSASSSLPRSSARECFEFILDDLDTAAKLLAKETMNGTGWKDPEWGRVTTGTALALKGRVLVLWASPQFNRANDQSRWTNAYAQMKAELDSINACGYGLYSETGDINATAFAHMFAMRKSSEAVFVTLHNTVDPSSDQGWNNAWERNIRPHNASMTGNGYEASAMMVDLFPMADGKKPKYVGGADRDYEPAKTWTLLEESSLDTEREYPFMNRDPRFYRTFAFPGVRWAYNGDASQGNSNNNPGDGNNYELWNYVWYASTDDQINVESGSHYGADNLLSNVRGIYVRKRTDDLDVNSPMYQYDNTASNAFMYSGAPYMEIRYAEVLLNLAEAACGAGDMAYAVELLQQIRARVGYTSDNNYGLQSNLASNQQACMSAVLYERMIELAYEGKRFDDMRRWMLYDGGAGISAIEGAPSTWKVTGWGGNTCTWLGYTPFNGQRRERMEFRVNDYYATNFSTPDKSTTYEGDPLRKAGIDRCAAIDLRNDITTQQEALKTWYSTYLTRANKGGDGYTNHVPKTVNFFAKYYFLGLSLGAQNRNDDKLQQTIGWEDNKHSGANGTFDPLAD